MTALPKCPKCSEDYTYEDGAMGLKSEFEKKA